MKMTLIKERVMASNQKFLILFMIGRLTIFELRILTTWSQITLFNYELTIGR